MSFLCLLPIGLMADDYLVEVKKSDKIIHVDELKLPSTATLEDVIYLLPELLGRPSYNILNNYDIEVDGFSIGASKDVVMSNLHAYSIETIKISESPANSYNNNGQGGTIKISLKDPKKGVSGNADIYANSSWNVLPSGQLDYKNDKGNFTLHAFAAVEVHKTAFDYVRYHMDPVSATSYNEYTDTTVKNYDSQLLRTYMKYAPNSRNKFEFVLSFDRISDGSKNRVEGSDPVTDRDVSYNGDANVKYILKTDDKGSEFSVEAKFGYHPVNEYQDIPDFRTRQTYGKNGSLVGCIEYMPVFSKALTMYFGSDYNLMTGSSDFNEESHYLGPMTPKNYSTITGSTFLSPYVKAEAYFGNWSLKASVEYQYYNFGVKATNISEPFENVRHDVTGSIYANWQVVPHHNLRFSLERKIKRPSIFQMTPDLTFDTSTYQYIVGNKDLNPMKIHDVGVDYITDFRSGNSLFTLNAGLDYMYVNDIIRSRKVAAEPASGMSEYLTYENSGDAGILCGNLFLYYRNGILSVSAAGNVYYNGGIDGDTMTKHTYYNISLQPTLSFPSNWIVLARAVWYSDIKTHYSYLGGFSTAYINVAKTWNHVTLGLSGQIPFPKYSLDMSVNSDDWFTYMYYRPTYGYISLKFSYRF